MFVVFSMSMSFLCSGFFFLSPNLLCICADLGQRAHFDAFVVVVGLSLPQVLRAAFHVEALLFTQKVASGTNCLPAERHKQRHCSG